ncbi:carboxymuconolactone decarboxylase family protein [Ponticaulis sp.]|uniref:carboxymuconolactone decarboxylase family protein n=1 Tax=Ponticaulis sp. TaxID=2020902 RepID=UPI002611BFD8|nr:carboxymuconolactone decarboxylase family protein [Ponticaulis sp.]MDF1679984.1 carboxymuconolactone decarboxylase family protein [Ponticaulis sp.]
MQKSILVSLALAFGSLGLSACTHTPASQTISAETDGFSPRVTEPRLPPVDPNNLTQQQAEMLAARADFNIYKTLAHHVDLYDNWSPLGRMLLNNTAVDLRHREMAMLRMGWLCQAEYEWAQHARIAHDNVGMTPDEIRDIAIGVEAGGWSELDRAVLNMADELRYDGRVSDATWQVLTSHYTEPQTVGLMYTALQYQLVSMALNSLGIQLDPELEFRLPTGLPMPPLADMVEGDGDYPVRVEALPVSEMSPQMVALVPERLREADSLPNYYGVLAQFPEYFSAQGGFARFLLGQTDLTPREREILILRTTALNGGAYEWAHHVSRGERAGLSEAEILALGSEAAGSGWTETESLLIAAANDLRREAFITDEVYAGLKAIYSDQQIVEMIYLVGGYSMFSSVMNTLGTQIEPGYPALRAVN